MNEKPKREDYELVEVIVITVRPVCLKCDLRRECNEDKIDHTEFDCGIGKAFKLKTKNNENRKSGL